MYPYRYINSVALTINAYDDDVRNAAGMDDLMKAKLF